MLWLTWWIGFVFGEVTSAFGGMAIFFAGINVAFHDDGGTAAGRNLATNSLALITSGTVGGAHVAKALWKQTLSACGQPMP
jgi:hypothetical protein